MLSVGVPTEANGASGYMGVSEEEGASVAAFGRYTAFQSNASNLVSGDTNGETDIFVHDNETGVTERVSVGLGGAQANEESRSPSISADGRYVAFLSIASNLVAGDTNNWRDVFVYDRNTETTTLVSVAAGGGAANSYSSDPAISRNGSYVAFTSAATNLVAIDTNGVEDVFLRELAASADTVMVSVDSSGVQGNGRSFGPTVSNGGTFVAFSSRATNLVTGDTNGQADVFRHATSTDETIRVSLTDDDLEAPAHSGEPSISADGNLVAFTSWPALVSGDTHEGLDVYVRDVSSASTQLISVDELGTPGNGYSLAPSISADGNVVAFETEADNLVAGGDANGSADVLVRYRLGSLIVRLSQSEGGTLGDGASTAPSLSPDGGAVVFSTGATNLVGDDGNGVGDVVMCGPGMGWDSIRRVSEASGGGQLHPESDWPAITPNGRYVAFGSAASNLVPGDTNGRYDVFVLDRQNGAIERVSVNGATQANRESGAPSISADGRYVAFMSYASNLVPEDANEGCDIYAYDRLLDRLTLVSVATGGVSGNGESSWQSMSADGQFVAFQSSASDLVAGDAGGFDDVFVRDLVAGTTTLISVAADGSQGTESSVTPAISADGSSIAFVSHADNLVGDDNNLVADVFVRQRLGTSIERVSVSSSGQEAAGGCYAWPVISQDGRYVAFADYAANLVAVDANNAADVFVRDRLLGTTERVSVSSLGLEANGQSGYLDEWPALAMSADGRHIAFPSGAANLVPGDTNHAWDLFVRDLDASVTERVNLSDAGEESGVGGGRPSVSADGRIVAFSSTGSDLVEGDSNGASDVFIRVRW